MLLIRRDQTTTFRRMAASAFEERLVAHLFGFSPLHCRGIGRARVEQAVQWGVGAAAACGFTQRGPVRLYAELMFLFGSRFATDPQLPPWASELLFDDGQASQLQRAGRLHARVVDYLRAVLGPGNVHARQVMARLLELTAQPAVEPQPQAIATLLAALAPERRALIGDAALAATAVRGIETAARRGLEPARGAQLCSLLQFELGHGCFDDPLYPWLADERGTTGAAERTARLERRAVTYLKLVLRRLGPAPCAAA